MTEGKKVQQLAVTCLGRTAFAFLLLCGGNHSAAAATVCSVHDFGATGDGVRLETKAINAAIQFCHEHGGGIVRLRPGSYKSGTIRLLDNVTLDIEAGAKIIGSSNISDYLPLAHASEGRDTALIVAENVHHVGIIGKGTIDGNGRSFIDAAGPNWSPGFDVSLTRQGTLWADRMRQSNEGPVRMLPRPGVLVLFLHADQVQLSDFHVEDSPNWTIKIGCSQHITVKHLDVRNSLLIPNNDALDISTSSHALVADSYLQAGDDALVIGGPCLDGWCQKPAQDITVKNVTLVSRSAALRIGPAAMDVRDLTFNHIVIKDSNRGIAIQTRAAETVENITFNDVVLDTRLIDGPWWGAGEPISISVAHWQYASWPQTESVGFIKHVRFANVVANSQSPVVIHSFETGHIEDIGFNGLSLSLHAGPLTSIIGGNLDVQPTTPVDLGVTRQDFSAVVVHNAEQLSLTNLKVRWFGTFPDFYKHALAADGTSTLKINHFTGSGSQENFAAISLGSEVKSEIHDATATRGQLLDKHTAHQDGQN